MATENIDLDREISRLVDIRAHKPIDVLIDELKLLSTWPRDQLSELLQRLCWSGGGRWPTVLYAMGADPNYVDDEGQTALSICVHGAGGEFWPKEHTELPVDTFETACELLELGASPNSPYMSECSVTSLALFGNLPQFVCLFLMAGADLDLEEPGSLSDKTLRQEIMASDRMWGRRLISICDRPKAETD